LEYIFENFTILDKNKNGKVQNRTLPSFIKTLYKTKRPR
jgi:Ca2+-binding EF-hand superfamily protein